MFISFIINFLLGDKPFILLHKDAPRRSIETTIVSVILFVNDLFTIGNVCMSPIVQVMSTLADLSIVLVVQLKQHCNSSTR